LIHEWRGKFIYTNDDVYEGGWKDDQHHGQGNLNYAEGGGVYEGDFNNVKKNEKENKILQMVKFTRGVSRMVLLMVKKS